MRPDVIGGAGEPAPPGPLDEPTPALDMRNITMRFGSFQALKNVNFQVQPAEIVALLGQNGSGKSTLVKVLAGVNVPEEGGELYLGGQRVPLPLAPGQFRNLGLSFVHQDLGLARTLTVVENLVVGQTGSARSRKPINWRAERKRVREVLDSYHVDVDVDVTLPINELAPVGQALVAIVRAAEELRLYRERDDVRHSILFLDEPTVFLPEAEVEFLFDLVRTVVAEGASTVFISHDLSAVRTLCDRAVVLRDGEVAGQARIADIDDQALIELIVGEGSVKDSAKGGVQGGGKTTDATRAAPAAGEGRHRLPEPEDADAAPVVCEVRGLSGGRVHDVDLQLRAGEIVGVAGLLGSGAEDLAYLLFGARTSAKGTMVLHGEQLDLPSLNPFDAVRRRVALVPADRRRDGIAASLTVSENATLLVNDRYTSMGRIRFGRLNELVRSLLDKFDVRPRDPDATIGQLSGGNQQKVVLAKWLEIKPRLLLLHEPTQGVDVAARAEIYRLVREASTSSSAVDVTTLWISSDFEELETVCDRVLIVANGAVRAQLRGAEVTEEKISSAVYYYSTDAAEVLSGAGGGE